jgi:hypothetical protein
MTQSNSEENTAAGSQRRAGNAVWIVVLFLPSAWLGAAVIFILFGFNPGGSVLKEELWHGAIVAWPTLMFLMLGFSIYFWRERRRRWEWLATLVLMAACPVWFPFAYLALVDVVSVIVKSRG